MKNDVDAIFVLAAGIKQDSSGRWVSTELTSEDNERGAPGGKLRIYAASILSALHPNALIITGGSKGFDVRKGVSDERPTLAEILYDELLETGIPLERIKLESNSNSTYQAFQEIEQIVCEPNIKRLIIVTNRYHYGRVKTMVDVKFAHFSLHAMLEFVTAEDILIMHDSERWKKHIDDAYRSEWMLARIAMEKQGIEQIRQGVYRFR